MSKKECWRCGETINNNTNKCPVCGANLNKDPRYKNRVFNASTYEEVEKADGSYYRKNNPYDTGGPGYVIIGFLLPIVGLIIYFLYKEERPASAKAARLGAIISLVIGFILVSMLGCIYFWV